ncbi:unnamed protein product [Leptidea sinapis]|uniref:Uncharacterized protein n=1 Tax=Leptidea sinapis TaxID=189913 RepID=A0A5E4QVB7_9NEOP|nr:unnamed protein product [Leptidea sinapis]
MFNVYIFRRHSERIASGQSKRAKMTGDWRAHVRQR